MTTSRGAMCGLAIGALNVFVVAIVIGIVEKEPRAFTSVGFVGAVPGMLVGTFIGALAADIGHLPPLVRAPLLAVLALSLVFVLGWIFGMSEMIVPASIPTFFAAWLLERITRMRVEEPVPTARAL